MLPLRVRVELGAITIKEYSAFLKAPALLKPDYLIVKCHIQEHFGGILPLYTDTDGVFNCFSRPDHVGGILPLYRDAVGVFYSHRRLGRVGGILPLSRDAIGVFYSSRRLGLVGGILPLYKDAVGVFYSPSQLGYSLRESDPSAEMQSVYSTATVDRTSIGELPLYTEVLIINTEASRGFKVKFSTFSLKKSARIYIHKLCADIGCSLEDLP